MIADVVRLGDVCEVIAGQSPESKYYNVEQIGLPFFQGKADFGMHEPTVRYYTSKITKKAIPNDILLSVRAPVGPTNICNIESCIGRGLAAIRGNDSAYYKYLYWYFKFIEPQLSQTGNGSTFSAIRSVDVKDIQIPLPSINIQIQIANTLDKVDALRRKDQELLRLFDNLAQSTFYAMFGNSFVPGTNSKSVFLSEIGEVVSGVAKNTRVVKDDYIEVPYMRVANVQDGHINLREVKTILVSKQDFDKYQLKKDDLLLTEGGDPDKLGRGAVWNGEISPCIHQNHIFRIRIKDKRIHPTFLTWVLSSGYGKAYFLKAAKQTTGIASINMTQLKNFALVIPNTELQTKFAYIIDNIENQKSLIIRQQANSDNLFKTLIQSAFNDQTIVC